MQKPVRLLLSEAASRAHVRIWMRNNQKGRRNPTTAWQIELELGNKADLLEIGKAKMGDSRRAEALSQNDKPSLPPVNTRKELAKAAIGRIGFW